MASDWRLDARDTPAAAKHPRKSPKENNCSRLVHEGTRQSIASGCVPRCKGALFSPCCRRAPSCQKGRLSRSNNRSAGRQSLLGNRELCHDVGRCLSPALPVQSADLRWTEAAGSPCCAACADCPSFRELAGSASQAHGLNWYASSVAAHAVQAGFSWLMAPLFGIGPTQQLFAPHCVWRSERPANSSPVHATRARWRARPAARRLLSAFGTPPLLHTG